MAQVNTPAVPLELLSSTERKALVVLKQPARVTVDDQDITILVYECTQARRRVVQRLEWPRL
jgi:hypothetical protein